VKSFILPVLALTAMSASADIIKDVRDAIADRLFIMTPYQDAA